MSRVAINDAGWTQVGDGNDITQNTNGHVVSLAYGADPTGAVSTGFRVAAGAYVPITVGTDSVWIRGVGAMETFAVT